jgi:hypothetical protein
MILTRSQFTAFFIETHFKGQHGDLVNDTSHPLWVPEQATNTRYEHFVMTKPVEINTEYWAWCSDTGVQTACFSSDDYKEEWWGFVTEQAAMLWSLKWDR